MTTLTVIGAFTAGAAIGALLMARHATRRLLGKAIVVCADAAGRVTTANESAARFYGVSQGELRGQRLQIGAHLPWREQLTAIGELTAASAHELRTPLTAIRSAAELAGHGVDPERRAALLTGLISEADALNDLIDDLTAFSAPPPADAAPVHVEQVVEEALAQLKGTLVLRSLRVDCAFRGNTLVPGDHRALRQAVFSLISHTLRSLPDGGALTIRTRFRPASRLPLYLTPPLDTPGPPRHLLELVIGPSSLAEAVAAARGAQPAVAGLAPAIAAEVIARGHGGSVLPSLAADGSTCFRVHLPALSEPAVFPTALRRALSIGDNDNS